MPPLVSLGIGFRHRYHYTIGGFRHLLHFCLFHSPQHSWGFEFGNQRLRYVGEQFRNPCPSSASHNYCFQSLMLPLYLYSVWSTAEGRISWFLIKPIAPGLLFKHIVVIKSHDRKASMVLCILRPQALRLTFRSLRTSSLVTLKFQFLWIY